jgi:hypothetical protein
MEMSPEYLAETVQVLESAGFDVARENNDYGDLDGPVPALRYDLRRGAREHFALEVVMPSGAPAYYFLELTSFHGLSSFSYPLDSWKHRVDRVEFRYYSDVRTGQGLALTLHLDPGPSR